MLQGLDRQNGYVFGTNPAGVEFDGQVSREGACQAISGGEGGFNLNWDTAWSVAATAACSAFPTKITTRHMRSMDAGVSGATRSCRPGWRTPTPLALPGASS